LVSTTNGKPTDKDLFSAITNGVPRSSMPPWAHLAAADRWALVDAVRDLTQNGFADRLIALAEEEEEDELSREEALEEAVDLLKPGASWAIPREEPTTLESLASGRQTYIEQCAQCHDRKGQGTGRTDLKDDKGRPIKPRDFTLGVFKGGNTGLDLAERLLSGIPGTPMPSFSDAMKNPDGTLNGKRLWSLVHYVRSLIRNVAC
jgi:cytochrome c oxidase cbb3-type subunit 2